MSQPLESPRQRRDRARSRRDAYQQLGHHDRATADELKGLMEGNSEGEGGGMTKGEFLGQLNGLGDSQAQWGAGTEQQQASQPRHVGVSSAKPPALMRNYVLEGFLRRNTRRDCGSFRNTTAESFSKQKSFPQSSAFYQPRGAVLKKLSCF